MSTMMQLFKDAGYANLNELIPFQEYQPNKKIEVKSFNQASGAVEWKEVTGLFFKGMSMPESSYAVYFEKGSTFLCTGDHLFYELASDSFVKAKDVKGVMVGMGADKNPLEIQVVPIKTQFPILDISVADNFTYFSNGVVSHNSFGGGGKLFSEGLKKLNPYISRFQTSVILLTQMRAKVGFQSYGPPDTPSGGGYAPRFYASWRARFSKGEEIKDKDEIIGNKINIKNSKSKIGFPKRGAELELFYGSGFSSDAEYIDFIIDLGLVKKGGAWFSQEQWGLKVQGRDALLKFLQSHKDIFEDCKKQVNDTFSKRTILDSMHISEESEEEDYDIKDHVEENQD